MSDLAVVHTFIVCTDHEADAYARARRYQHRLTNEHGTLGPREQRIANCFFCQQERLHDDGGPADA